MDAKITRDRLGNLLSYDWLKMIVAIVLAVCALTVFFTTVGTVPTAAQTFTVYAYGELFSGEGAGSLTEDLKQDVFSYEILLTEAENFNGNTYRNAAFTARRTAGQGTVMFLSNHKTGEEETEFEEFFKTALNKTDDGEELGMILDTEQYFLDCEAYLKTFFGENWQEGALDSDAAERCFRARNTGDKRFKSEAQIARGIASEEARLEKLRTDLQFVNEQFESGVLTHITMKSENEYSCAISMNGLDKIVNLYYYTEDGVKKGDDIALVLFDNGTRTGDMKFEAVSFLKFLVQKYGA